MGPLRERDSIDVELIAKQSKQINKPRDQYGRLCTQQCKNIWSGAQDVFMVKDSALQKLWC